MTQRPPFDMLRAAFFLLAIILLAEVGLAIFAAVGCYWLVITSRLPVGSCANTTQVIREVFSEMLAAVLALLLAAKSRDED